MKYKSLILGTGVIAASAVAILGCRAVPAVEDSATPTLAALREASTLPSLPAGSPAEISAVEGFKAFLAEMKEPNIVQNTRKIYSTDAYFNDTLKSLKGSAAIEQYLVATARSARAIRVDYEDTTRAGDGTWYIRWRMQTEVARVAGGRPVTTVGITHIRFNSAGQVTYHQDYWDSTAGVFDHIPVIGRGTRFIKKRI